MRHRVVAVLLAALMTTGCSSLGIGGMGAQSVEDACAVTHERMGDDESLFRSDPAAHPKKWMRDLRDFHERLLATYDDIENITVKNQLDETAREMKKTRVVFRDAFAAIESGSTTPALATRVQDVVDRFEEQMVKLEKLCPTPQG